MARALPFYKPAHVSKVMRDVCNCQDVNGLKALLERVPSSNAQLGESVGSTLLVVVIRHGWVEGARVLLEAGADPNLSSQGVLPLEETLSREHLTAWGNKRMEWKPDNRLSMLNLLFAHGAQVALSRDSLRRCAAVAPTCVARLLEAGANPNEQDPDNPQESVFHAWAEGALLRLQWGDSLDPWWEAAEHLRHAGSRTEDLHGQTHWSVESWLMEEAKTAVGPSDHETLLNAWRAWRSAHALAADLQTLPDSSVVRRPRM